MERSPHVYTINWFIDLKKMDRLDLNPEFQRYSVWNLQYRQFFIDTIIRNFPSPTIFLVKNYSEKLEAIYGVVDGKQRLTSIFMYLDGEFASSKYDNQPELSEKYFNELPATIKKAFFDYKIRVEVLDTNNPTEINESFDRMNRNVIKLNAQELRHAKYSGKFINFCEIWTANPWFQTSDVCIQRRAIRMADVEFISELIVLTEKGVQNGKSILDDIYSEYDEEIPEETKLSSDFQGILEVVIGLGLSNNSKDPFGKIVDIYSLWGAIRNIHLNGKRVDIEKSKSALSMLATEIEGKTTADAIKYYENAQRQTNSFRSRSERVNIIESRIVALG